MSGRGQVRLPKPGRAWDGDSLIMSLPLTPCSAITALVQLVPTVRLGILKGLAGPRSSGKRGSLGITSPTSLRGR